MEYQGIDFEVAGEMLDIIMIVLEICSYKDFIDNFYKFTA
jgi:hypothetical protein